MTYRAVVEIRWGVSRVVKAGELLPRDFPSASISSCLEMGDITPEVDVVKPKATV